VFVPAYGPPLNYASGNPRAKGGNPDITPYLQGPATPPLPQENGWKDTVIAFPGQVTRFLVRWAETDVPANTPAKDAHLPFDPHAGGGGYVWHCHIVDHEDNEMMRPDAIMPNTDEANRSYRQGIDY
jgi:FtsP/CotA-like multicopper oxidase with cupredoxin domain